LGPSELIRPRWIGEKSGSRAYGVEIFDHAPMPVSFKSVANPRSPSDHTALGETE